MFCENEMWCQLLTVIYGETIIVESNNGYHDTWQTHPRFPPNETDAQSVPSFP